MKPLLCRTNRSIGRPMQLFVAIVGQTVPWCTESWSITEDEKRILNSAQNCMLRKVEGCRRAPDQLWVEWVRSFTHLALHKAQGARIRIWLDSHLKSKGAWAGHVQRMGSDCLAQRVGTWHASVWWSEEMHFPPHLRKHRAHRTHWF